MELWSSVPRRWFVIEDEAFVSSDGARAICGFVRGDEAALLYCVSYCAWSLEDGGLTPCLSCGEPSGAFAEDDVRRDDEDGLVEERESMEGLILGGYGV